MYEISCSNCDYWNIFGAGKPDFAPCYRLVADFNRVLGFRVASVINMLGIDFFSSNVASLHSCDLGQKRDFPFSMLGDKVGTGDIKYI